MHDDDKWRIRSILYIYTYQLAELFVYSLRDALVSIALLSIVFFRNLVGIQDICAVQLVGSDCNCHHIGYSIRIRLAPYYSFC